MSSSVIELTGQCTHCKDIFTVEMIPSRRSNEKPHMRYYRPLLTPRLAWKNRQIIHRPKVCGGVVKLFGSFRTAIYHAK